MSGKIIVNRISLNILFFLFFTGLSYSYGYSRDTIPAAGANANPHFTIPSTSEKIRVDGFLNEGFWNDALAIELPYEVDPGENVKAPVETYVLLSCSKTHLYIGFKAYDPEPSKILAHYMDRDKVFADDAVGVILDTYNDERRSFDFISNPLGIQEDAIESSNGYDASWDAIWESRGRIAAEGYFVEMSIPFTSLRFQRSEGPQTWGFDAIRSYPREVRHHIGTFKRDRNRNCYLCQSIKITGFEDVTPGKNIELDPTLSILLNQVREDETEGDLNWETKKVDPGLTARWGITPNIILAGTLNPDFSQVEADAAQMDVNEPFDLFYPEKRPFFTEGADFFHPSCVYTRILRDPVWGIKLTGKEKGNTIGSYIVQDRLTNLVFPGSQGNDATTIEKNSYNSVLRYKRDLGNKYTLGVLLTDREGDDYFNRIALADAYLRITEKEMITIEAGMTSTHYPDTIIEEFDQPGGTFNSHGVALNYYHNTRNIDWSLTYNDFGKNLRVDQGFLPQVDIKDAEAEVEYTWLAKERDSWWSQMHWEMEYEYLTDQNYDLLKSEARLGYEILMIKQSHIVAEYYLTRENYNDSAFNQSSFYIHHCLKPVGNLHYWITILFGDRIDYTNTRSGNRFHLNVGFNWSLGMHLNMELNHMYEKLDVDPGRLYTANILEGRLTYQFTKQFFMRIIMQYRHYDYNTVLYINPDEDPPEPLEQYMFSQFLLSYKLNPQTVLFLGYSDNYTGGEINERDTPLTQTNWTFFFKIGYAFVM